jgi:hypothetical protein
MAIKLPEDFKEFLLLLNSLKVKYLVIGGYAVGYYGYPRATGDLDIWVKRDKENAEKIVEALSNFGFASESILDDLFLKENQVIRMGMPPLRIEILTSISGVTFDGCYAKRVKAEIDGIELSLIGLEDLKINKKASGRMKDLNDLENLP